jgi:hypothetical protein
MQLAFVMLCEKCTALFYLMHFLSFFFKGVILKPVVYGNVAKYFGKKREEDGHTHQW